MNYCNTYRNHYKNYINCFKQYRKQLELFFMFIALIGAIAASLRCEYPLYCNAPVNFFKFQYHIQAGKFSTNYYFPDLSMKFQKKGEPVFFNS